MKKFQRKVKLLCFKRQVKAHKKAAPLICLIGCNGIMAYFFGIYWLSNPD